uniref:HEAT repeat domain-containing protein n=2 Tax=Bursaphelenchus xylophilus TaxID=6326 RepID=A0A1I7SL92_BURXY
MPPRNIEISPPSLISSSQSKNASSRITFAVKETEKEVELRQQCLDPDPRVRTEAIQSFEKMCKDGKMISIESYSLLSELSTNSAKNVRLSALRLVQLFAERYPE